MALILIAENDVLLRADGKRYADLLEKAGVFVNLYCQKGIGHLAQNGARASKKARESLDVAASALKGFFLTD